MIIECAQCKKKLGEKEPLENKAVTHTLCEKCRLEFLEDAKKFRALMGKNGDGN